MSSHELTHQLHGGVMALGMRGRPALATGTGDQAAATPSAPGGRRLLLVDLDNITGMKDLDVPGWRTVVQDMWIELGITSDDKVVVAMCRRTLAAAMPVLVGVPAQLLARGGKDGAKIAILDAVDVRHMAERFEVLVIVSGDHFFIEMAEQARAQGMYVWQVCSARAGCAKRLRLAADYHSELASSRSWPGEGEERPGTYAEAS